MDDIKQVIYESDPKQVIVLRKDLNMRKGKMCAQAAHASMAVLLNLGEFTEQDHNVLTGVGDRNFIMSLNNEALFKWVKGAFKKITVGVDAEAELLELYAKAKDAGVLCSIIRDSGLTEFGGVPTLTAVAIGPAFPKEIDPITGHLKLL